MSDQQRIALVTPRDHVCIEGEHLQVKVPVCEILRLLAEDSQRDVTLCLQMQQRFRPRLLLSEVVQKLGFRLLYDWPRISEEIAQQVRRDPSASADEQSAYHLVLIQAAIDDELRKLAKR